jgi:hypothetical protein
LLATVLVGDFDEDGISDLAATMYASGRVAILRGNGSAGVGDGTFLAPVTYGTGQSPPFGIVQADFDEDGIIDLATANHNLDPIWVLRGLGTGGVGDGTFDPVVSYAAGNAARALATGDWNEDGIVDLITTNENVDSLTILMGAGAGGVGNGTFGNPIRVRVGDKPIDVASADLNGDGHLDIGVAHSGTGDVRILLGSCSPQYGLAPHIDAVRDVPGDQGRKVFVLWKASPLDGPIGTSVAYYKVWRRSSPASAWEEVAPILHAERLAGYGYTASTVRDSTSGGNPFTSFRVTAYVDDQGLHQSFFESHPESGYSVDNLPVSIPLDDGIDGGIDVTVGELAAAPELVGQPILHGLSDVPGDQGGAVRVEWEGSDFDPGAIIYYRLWRRIPPVVSDPITYWEVFYSSAHGFDEYSVVAPTTRDSLPGDNPYTAFFVTAGTDNWNVFYRSAIDSGYSVDNLAPPALANLTGYYQPDRVTLIWGASTAPDAAWYRVYRGATPDFVPASGNRISTQTEPGYVDFDAVAPLSYYKLTVVDVHGNEGLPALVATAGPVDVPAERPQLNLRVSNPSFGGLLRVAYALPTDEPGRLEIFDVAGRRVHATAISGAGEHGTGSLADLRLAPGAYVVRLTHAGTTLQEKAILLP